MTRMADLERPRDEQDYDDERFEDEGRRSIFSALWFRAILVVIVLGVVAAVAVPYVLELANQPAPKTTALVKPETPPVPAPVAPPVASPSAPSTPAPSVAAAPEKPSMTEKPAVAEKPAVSEGSASMSSMSASSAPATEKPAAPAAKKPEASKTVVASKSAAAKEPAAARAPRAAAPSPTGAGEYFVQVGAFRNPDTAKKLAVRLREQKYNVEETSATGVKTARSAAPSAPPASGSASDRYDVHVAGAAPAEINAKLSAKGLTAEPSGGGVVVKPSMPLRDAVALSKDLAVDGLKVQVRRASAGAAPAPAAASSAPAVTGDGTVYRVRVGPFDDKTTATSTLRELEQKGYSPFIARGGQ
jgi:cell division septation protein DedD